MKKVAAILILVASLEIATMAVFAGFLAMTVPSTQKVNPQDKSFQTDYDMSSFDVGTSTVAYVDHRGCEITIWLANDKDQWRRQYVYLGDFLSTRIVSLNQEADGDPGKGNTQVEYDQLVNEHKNHRRYSRAMWW